MMVRKWVLTPVIAVVLAALAACSSPPTVVQMAADYPGYDQSTLFSEASIIVEGTVLATAYRVDKPQYVGDTPEENPLYGLPSDEVSTIVAQDSGVPTTVVTLRVDAAYKGGVAVGETITVVRTGGVIDGVDYRVAGESALEANGRYLLFAADSSAGEYYILGGQTGVYAVTGDGYAATGAGAPYQHLTAAEVTDQAATR